jgi:hypothetical protein
MEIVPKDSRYIPFSQQPYCCVPTCIQMIIYRHNIPLIPAELLGYYLGLNVPPDTAKFFWNVRMNKKPPISGYGTQVYEKEFEPNRAFKKLKIPLKLEFKLISSFENFSTFKKYLAELSKKDFDVFACFNHGVLIEESDKDWGHVCVIDKIYPSKNTVRLIDPARAPKWRVVTMKKLYEAMRAHRSKKSAGFWELYLTS